MEQIQLKTVNPFLIEANPNLDTLTLLKQWASVYDSVDDLVDASVWTSVWTSVGASVSDSVRASVRASVSDSVYASVSASVYNSVYNSVSAYIGGLFPTITDWKYIDAGKLSEGVSASDPWRPLLALWYGGYVPSFDGTVWRLHSDKDARIVLTWNPITGGTIAVSLLPTQACPKYVTEHSTGTSPVASMPL